MQTTTARPSRNARLEFGRVALVGIAMLIGSLAMTAGRAQTAAPAAAPPTQDAAAKRDRLLVFSKTAGFRHQSIPDGIKALREILGGRYEIDASEDSAVFTVDNLKR
jgi:hypothetical protein